MRKQRARRISTEVYNEIVTYVLQHKAPTEIRKLLENDKKFAAVDVPSLPTIRDIWKEHRPRQPSDPWSLTTDEVHDATEVALIIDSLAQLIGISGGSIKQVTNAEADLLVKVRGAAPRLHIWIAWCFVHEYLLSDEDELQPIDALLAAFTRPTRGELDLARRIQQISMLWPDRKFSLWWKGPQGPDLEWMAAALEKAVDNWNVEQEKEQKDGS